MQHSHFMQSLSRWYIFLQNFHFFQMRINSSHQWCSQPKSLGVKIFDFCVVTVFCLGYRFSKHKMTRDSEHLRAHDPLATPVFHKTLKLTSRTFISVF